MKVAWLTPLSERSAIAEYSVNVCAALADQCAVELYACDDQPWRGCAVPVLDARAGLRPESLAGYDHVVYNLGDHLGFHRVVYEVSRRHPGICVLHDRTYDNLIARRDTNEIASVRTATAGALGVIVHADDHARELEAEWFGPVGRIPFPVYADRLSTGSSGKTARHPRTLVSLGYVNPNRQIHRVLEVLHGDPQLREHLDYRVVGLAPDENYARMLHELVDRHGLASHVRLLFGYQPDEEFRRHLETADAVVNLREPPLESASASFLEQLARGKPVVVSDVGYFSEVPDDAVFRIPPADDAALRRALWTAATDEKACEGVGRRARQFAATLTVEKTAEQIVAFLEETTAWRPLLRLTERVAVELASFRASSDAEVVGQVAAQIAPLASE